MNKWTAAVALLLAAVLGGAYWVMSQKKQMALSQPTAVPSETDGPDEEFETDTDLGDPEGLVDGQDATISELPPPASANPGDKPSSDPLISNDPVDTMEDADDGGAADQDPIVIEDKDGVPPPPVVHSPKAAPGP